MFTLAIAIVAEAVAITSVVIGPDESLGFYLRLPLLVLTAGALVTASQWRRVIILTPDQLVARSLFRTRHFRLSSITRVRRRTTSLTLVEQDGWTSTIRTGACAEEVAEAIEASLTCSPADYWYPVPVSVPMATPWLVLNSSAGVAVLAAKGYENHPALIASLLGIAGLTALLTLGGCLLQWLRAQS